MFVHRLSPLQAYLRIASTDCGWVPVYVIYFHRIVPVSLICIPIIIYPPLWRYIADSVWDLAAPAKKRLPVCLLIITIKSRCMAADRGHLDFLRVRLARYGHAHSCTLAYPSGTQFLSILPAPSPFVRYFRLKHYKVPFCVMTSQTT